MLQIEVLQTTVARIVEKDHDDHDLSLGKCAITMALLPSLSPFYGLFCHHCIKKLAKNIRHAENSCNFVFSKH